MVTPRHSGRQASSCHNIRVFRCTWAIVGGAAIALSSGCNAESSEAWPGSVDVRVAPGRADATIFGGAKDDDEGAAVGVVALRIGRGTFELCTGTLIASNVILTARHCVTKNLTTSVACDENGRSANGTHVTTDEDPGSIGVYLGPNPRFERLPVAVGRAIVSPSGPYLCDSDVALVVLATSILTVPPLAVRLHAGTRPGELIRSVGYGQNDTAMPIGTRFRRPGVEVLAQGKAISPSKTPLGPHEFEVGKSICQGDSGGPAISEATGAVIGVVSRGGACDEDFGHIYTTLAGFDDMFAAAFRLAHGTPTLESGASPSTTQTVRAQSGESTGAPDHSVSAASCSLAPHRAQEDLSARFGGLALGVGALGVLGARARRRRILDVTAPRPTR